MRFKTAFIAALTILAVCAAGVCAGEAAQPRDDERYRFEERFEADLAGVDLVGIEITNGSIDIEIWGNERIEIVVDERIRAESEAEAEEIAEMVRLVGEQTGSTLQISVDRGSLSRQEYGRRYAGSLEVKLPARLALSLVTTNGSIGMPAMAGDVAAHTTNGSIGLAGCGGDAELDTTNGNITAGAVAGELDADTTNGNLQLECSGGPVSGHTTNGNVRVSITGALGGDVELSSTNGGIDLTVGEGSGFRIDASVGNGRVRDSLEGFQGEYNRRRTRLEGTYGDGRHSVTLNTSNGSIEIQD